MILLTGVTGKTGGEVLRSLLDRNLALRALVRDPDSARRLAAPQVELVQGDFEDPASLAKAMRGIDQAFMLMPNTEKQLQNEMRFVDVARKEGVRRVVKLSASGADPNSTALLKRFHGESEVQLAKSGLAYTIVRPNFYMQNMLQCAASIAAADSFRLPMGAGRTGIIDVMDVGDFIARVLTGSGHEGQTYYITGPEILSFQALAEHMSGVLGRKIEYVDVPAREFGQQLRAAGASDWYIEALGELFEIIANDGGAKITSTFEAVCGRPPRTFRQFVKRHAVAFSPS
jgi:uncharacterized protein YbjT (DUF2867 family)